MLLPQGKEQVLRCGIAYPVAHFGADVCGRGGTGGGSPQFGVVSLLEGPSLCDRLTCEQLGSAGSALGSVRRS